MEKAKKYKGKRRDKKCSKGYIWILEKYDSIKWSSVTKKTLKPQRHTVAIFWARTLFQSLCLDMAIYFLQPIQWKMTIMCWFNSLSQTGKFIKMKGLFWRTPKIVSSFESWGDKSQIVDTEKWTIPFWLYTAFRKHGALLNEHLRYFKYYFYKCCLLC